MGSTPSGETTVPEDAGVAAPREERITAESERDVDRPPPEESPPEDEIVPWSPPDVVAPSTVPVDARPTLERWVSQRDTLYNVEVYHPVPGARLIAARYIQEMIAAGEEIDQNTSESAFRVTIVPTFRSEQSEKNRYGAVELSIAVSLEGPDLHRSETTVVGPLMLSRVSSTDGQLNSIRRIDRNRFHDAIQTLRAEIGDDVSQHGLPYRVIYPPPGIKAPNDHPIGDDTTHVGALTRVFRSIGIPSQIDGVWYLYAPPEPLRDYLQVVFQGSGYDFLIHPLTREIRIIYNGGDKNG